MERDLVIIDLLHSIAEPLARAYDATRVRRWPIGRNLEIEAIAGAADLEHVNCFIDAVETFHPGSSVMIWFDRPMPLKRYEQSVAPAPRLKRLEWDVMLGPPPVSPSADVLVLLHPYPFTEGVQPAALKKLTESFSRVSARRKWIYFRNLELWDGSQSARIMRRMLNGLRRPIEARLDRVIDKRFDELVRPKIQSLGVPALAGIPPQPGTPEPKPCEHRHAFRVLNKPRPIDFCPDCGMGLTAPDAIPPAAQLAGIYGEHYALGYRYVGRREYSRFQRDEVKRIAGYLDQLGFAPPQKESPSILDFGCGGGLYTPLWLERGWRYTGVDFAPGAIENASRNNPTAKFVVGGLDAQEVAAGAPYDMIYLSHVLEHVPDPAKLLRELRERSAPGGHIYVEVPDAVRATWDLTHRGFANCEHLWDFTPNALRALAASAGWREIRMHQDPSDAYANLSLMGRNVKM